MKPTAVALALVLAGCTSNALTPTDGVRADDKIMGGSSPYAPRHDATVALHQVSRGSLSRSPFCTGTLIAMDWVLTAAHCVEGTSASAVAIYVGDDPSVDLYDHYYLATQVVVHPSYNSRQIINDVALIHIDRYASSPAPVPWLPAEKGLTSSDEGMTVDFAGFGIQDGGGFGTKLHVEGKLDRVYSTQVEYGQADGGPCNGDSGGPMFVQDGGTWYVAGITSYGDSYCSQYGVSTKVDAFDDFISSYVGEYTEPTTSTEEPSSSTSSSSSSSSDTTAPSISGEWGDVNGTNFTIGWDTNEASDSYLVFETYGAFGDDTLTTSHEVSLRGGRGATYVFTIESTDAAGNTGVSGPWQISL